MDSLTQAALGAAVSVAVMGRRSAAWKAAALGAVAGTLPDMDVLFDHGDPILNMVLHRAESHALFWLALASLPLGWLAALAARQPALWRRWWGAIAAALLTHPLLDAFTIYGTQLLLPFSREPVGLGSIFIIDPAYTLPLLLGVIGALALARRPWGLKLNAAGLVLSTAYIGWSVAAQAQVQQLARESLTAQGLKSDRLLVLPTPFNTVLWRVLAVDEAGDRYHEGFVSFFDAPAPPAQRIRFDAFPRGQPLAAELAGHDGVRRIQAFSDGFWAMDEVPLAATAGGAPGSRIRITDLRMGQEPSYTFSFLVAERRSPPVALVPAVAAGTRPDVDRALPWLWQRLLGPPRPPPRGAGTGPGPPCKTSPHLTAAERCWPPPRRRWPHCPRRRPQPPRRRCCTVASPAPANRLLPSAWAPGSPSMPVATRCCVTTRWR